MLPHFPLGQWTMGWVPRVPKDIVLDSNRYAPIRGVVDKGFGNEEGQARDNDREKENKKCKKTEEYGT